MKKKRQRVPVVDHTEVRFLERMQKAFRNYRKYTLKKKYPEQRHRVETSIQPEIMLLLFRARQGHLSLSRR